MELADVVFGDEEFKTEADRRAAIDEVMADNYIGGGGTDTIFDDTAVDFIEEMRTEEELNEERRQFMQQMAK
jgi:hypothetical protein